MDYEYSNEFIGKRVTCPAKEQCASKLIGNIESLPEKANKKLNSVINATSSNDGLTLTLALSYGSQDELVQAIRKVAKQVAEGDLKPESITEEHIEKHLFTAGMPHPDLLVRTSENKELVTTCFGSWPMQSFTYSSPWPDFDAEGLYEAIAKFQKENDGLGRPLNS